MLGRRDGGADALDHTPEPQSELRLGSSIGVGSDMLTDTLKGAAQIQIAPGRIFGPQSALPFGSYVEAMTVTY